MMTKTLSAVFCAGALAMVAGTAHAQEANYEEPGMYSYAWNEPRLQTGIGIGIAVGGGVGGFTSSAMRTTTTDVGGLWNARVTIGTHIPLALDISYIGTAANVNTFSGQPNGTLIGTDVEGAVRFNILPHYDWTPYIFGGAGWGHYNLSSPKFATADSGMASSDDLVVFPMGVGFGYRDLSGFTFDMRGTFRATTNSNLLFDANTNSHANLDTWEASASLGYEF
jgi:hypothetical protein